MAGTAVLTAEPRAHQARFASQTGQPATSRNDFPAMRAWAAKPLPERIDVLRRARTVLTSQAEEMAEAISPELDRSRADTLVAEVLPLLAAMRYLEREAAAVLRPRHVGARGRPMWLGRVTSVIERVPLGRVLVIGPGNYPLLLPGVQVIQALAAGNAAAWKPGRGGARVAAMIAGVLRASGLPEGVLEITDESVAAGYSAMAHGVDKVFFTGSAAAGRDVMRRAAELLIPSVMELSGADAAIVLPSAKAGEVARAMAFALRLNGSATCMAPRRLLLVDATGERRLELLEALWREVFAIGPVAVRAEPLRLVTELLDEARGNGATVLGGGTTVDGRFEPALVLHGTPGMRVTQTDVFAPVLTVLEVDGTDGVVAAHEACPLALTASIFGEEREAKRVAARLLVGHISINDVLVPTADPRVPFTARRGSGFGSTRGAEGLLEMTTVRVTATRRGSGGRRYERTGPTHEKLFAGLGTLFYSRGLLTRLRGAKRMVQAARELSETKQGTDAGDV